MQSSSVTFKRRPTSLQPISPKPGNSGQICTSYFGVNCPFLNGALITSTKELPVTHSGFKKTPAVSIPPRQQHHLGVTTRACYIYVHTKRLIIMCHYNGQLLVAQCSAHFNLSFPHRARSQSQTRHEASAVPRRSCAVWRSAVFPGACFPLGAPTLTFSGMSAQTFIFLMRQFSIT